MTITTIQPFLSYLDRIRFRTHRLMDMIPPDKIEWTYQEGKFTLGDILRHIANIERYMYGETVQGRPSAYSGCGKAFADGYEAVITYVDQMHAESVMIFTALSDEDLLKQTTTPAGTPITTWKWLRAMVEHEIHHRGQLYMYLAMLNIKTPPIYGLTAEEVAAYSRKKP